MNYKELKSFCGGEGLAGGECGSKIYQENHRLKGRVHHSNFWLKVERSLFNDGQSTHHKFF